MKKRKCAVFTIVKNESYFLPIWINHYKKYFNVDDIYILDHESNDGSTSNLDVNVVHIFNDLAFDHQWLIDTVQGMQKTLLNDYDCVLFAESDELIYTLEKPLNEVILDFINDENSLYQTATGRELIQDLENEKPLEDNDNIFEFRSLWFDDPQYHKTLLSKIPLEWIWGFHKIKKGEIDKKYGLWLCHLHRCDFNKMLKRHEERAKKWKLKDDGEDAGFQHRIGDREGVLNYFNNIPNKPEQIPNNHKEILK